MRRFYINCASMVTFGSGNPASRHFMPTLKEIIGRAKAIGYDGVQGLPIRGATGQEPVDYYEGAWNAVNGFWDGVLHRFGSEGMPANWKDWLLFPDRKSCLDIVLRGFRKPGQHEIRHDWQQPFGHVEISPLLEDTLVLEEVAAKCRRGGYRLVLDTLHLLEFWQMTGNSDWTELAKVFKMVAPYVELVHVHPVNGLREFLSDPVNSMTGTLLKMLLGSRLEELPMVAEYQPTYKAMFCRKESDWLATRFLEAMKAL